MNEGIPKGSKVKAKIKNKWVATTVVSHDAVEGWIELESKIHEAFMMNTKIHNFHLKLPDIKIEKPLKKKRVRKKRIRKNK